MMERRSGLAMSAVVTVCMIVLSAAGGSAAHTPAGGKHLAEVEFQPDACVCCERDSTWARDDWTGDGYYGPAGNQCRTASVNAGQTAVFYISVQNDGQADDSFVIRGRAADGSWTVRYSDAFPGGSDVTAQVSGAAGWTVGPVAPGAAVAVRCEMTAPADGIGNSWRSRVIRATSIGDPAKYDAAKVVTRIRAHRRPDGWVRVPGKSWVGSDIYNNTGAGQRVTRWIRALQTAAYHVCWQNDGNVADSFRITGPGDEGDWKVRYYDSFSAGTDITAEVTGSGWETPPTPPGGRRPIRVEVSVRSGAPSGIARTIRLEGASTGDDTKRDVVRARTIIR